MLYVWARGLVLADRLGVQPVISSWTQMHPGVLLRQERSARLYWRQLRSSPLPVRLLAWWRCRRVPPFVGELHTLDAPASSHYLVCNMGPQPADDSFRDLKAHRLALRAAFARLLYSPIRRQIERAPAPYVGIHVRRGDFRQTNWITPIEYFCTRLQSVRDVCGQSLPATVFSDGSNKELIPLLRMTAVTRAQGRCEVVDLCSLSKSRLIIASGVSTFGNWASFLSDGIILRNPRWLHQQIRPADVNEQTYEGTPEMDTAEWPDLLRRNLAALASLAARRAHGSSIAPCDFPQ